MGLIDRLLNWLGPEPKENWHVQFEESGRIYTYHRTGSQMTKEMRARAALPWRGPPHRIWVVRDGREVEMRI